MPAMLAQRGPLPIEFELPVATDVLTEVALLAGHKRRESVEPVGIRGATEPQNSLVIPYVHFYLMWVTMELVWTPTCSPKERHRNTVSARSM